MSKLSEFSVILYETGDTPTRHRSACRTSATRSNASTSSNATTQPCPCTRTSPVSCMESASPVGRPRASSSLISSSSVPRPADAVFERPSSMSGSGKPTIMLGVLTIPKLPSSLRLGLSPSTRQYRTSNLPCLRKSPSVRAAAYPQGRMWDGRGSPLTRT